MLPEIITPPQEPKTLGLVTFLAGPIQGAKHWQNEAIRLLSVEIKVPAWIIASPRRSDDTWQNDYDGQVEWETRWLAMAGRTGVILFWLAKEDQHRCDRAYAQTTRFELGEWFGRFDTSSDGVNLVIGIEEGYTGARYVRKRIGDWVRRFNRMHDYTIDFPIYDTLEATCAATIKKLEAQHDWNRIYGSD